MTFTEIENTLWEWANNFTPAEVKTIWGNENAPRPSDNFIVMTIMNVKQIGESYRAPADDTGIQKLYYDIELVLNVQAIGENSNTNIYTLKESLEKWECYDYLQKIAVRNKNEPLLNISSTISDNIEKRFSWDITFGVRQVVEQDVGYIENVNITENYENPI